MSMYKESMRRTAGMGVALALLTLIATVIYAVMSCDAAEQALDVVDALHMTPALGIYAYLGGIGLAFTGFSFLRRRPDSDFYHSIPVKRADIYLSVTFASATWMLATCLVCVVSATAVFLFAGRPFAPAYPLMNLGFFFAASMLVFAAAAIGCSLTGTLLTNIILTGLVLFLPRYILFMIGRTLVADTEIIAWMDLTGLLNPTTNAATGLIVMLSRQMFTGSIVNVPGILWSLFVAAAELLLGGVLFVRRQSEIADHSAGSQRLQVLYACLLALPVLLIFMLRPDQLSPAFIVMIFAASLAAYVLYQVIAVRSFQRIMLSLPWYICAVAVSMAVLFGTRAVAKQVQEVCPDIAAVAYVTFPGEDRGSAPVSYGSLAVSEVQFTERSVRECVVEALRTNIRTAQSGEGYTYTDRWSIQPVRIVLNNGRVINRTILFTDGEALNACRSENAAYCEAIGSAAPASTNRRVGAYRNNAYRINTQDVLALRDCYFAECDARGDLSPYASFNGAAYASYEGPFMRGEAQQVGTLYVSGYHGTARYYDSYTITLSTPQTASLWMRFCNDANGDELNRLKNAYAAAQNTDFTVDGGYFYAYFNFLNFPSADGGKQAYSFGLWDYGTDDTTTYYPALEPYIDELMTLLCRGTLTDDPGALSMCVSWSMNASGNELNSIGQAYYGYSEADAMRMIEIICAWNSVTGDDAGVSALAG